MLRKKQMLKTDFENNKVNFLDKNIYISTNSGHIKNGTNKNS